MSVYGNSLFFTNESVNFTLNGLKSALGQEVENNIDDEENNDKICNNLVKELKNNFIKSYDKIYKKFESTKNNNFLSDIKINSPNDFLKYMSIYHLHFDEVYGTWQDGTKYYAVLQFFIFYKEYEKLSEEDKKNNNWIVITLKAAINEKYKPVSKTENWILGFYVDG